MKIGLVALSLLSSATVKAHQSQRGYKTQRSYYQEIYREYYVPSIRSSQGYIKSFTNKVEVACNPLAKVHHQHNHHERYIPSYNYSSYRTRYNEPASTYKIFRPNSSSCACRSSRATGGVLGAVLLRLYLKKMHGVGQFH